MQISIPNIILESYPNNPNTIILKNEWYPNGLIELDIYKYYISQKNNIIDQIKDHYVLIYLATKLNDLVVRRKLNQNNYIKLTKENYDKLITGRTVSLHQTMNKLDDHGIVDIDYHDFHECKLSTLEVNRYLSNYYPTEIRFTGKSSFHIIIKFNKKKDINDIKIELKKLLENAPFSKNYIIGGFRSESKINLDLSSNKFNGNHICLYALSIIGLKCVPIKENDIINFNKENSII